MVPRASACARPFRESDVIRRGRSRVRCIRSAKSPALPVGESASLSVRQGILAALESPEVVDRVINSRRMHLGPDEVLVATKLAVGETDSAAEVVAAINGAERAARESVPRLKLAIYLEPDVDTAPGSPSVDGPGVPAIPSDVDDSAVEDASRG